MTGWLVLYAQFTDECRVHPRNRYFTEHKMTVEEFDERMAAIEEHRNETHVG